MNRSEERQMEVLTSKLSATRKEKLAVEKKLRQRDLALEASNAEKEELRGQLSDALAKVSDSVSQIVQFLMGNGATSLSDSLLNPIIAGVRTEFEQQINKMKEDHAKEIEGLTSRFEAIIAAKDNEINRLRHKDGNHSDNSSSASSSSQDGVDAETQLKTAKQRINTLANMAMGQSTESAYSHHGQAPVDSDECDMNGEDIPEEEIVRIAKEVKVYKDMKGVKKPRREQPLVLAASEKDDEYVNPDFIPEGAEFKFKKKVVRYIFVDGYVRVKRIFLNVYRLPDGSFISAKLPKKYHNCLGRTNITEGLMAKILTMHYYDNMTIGDIEAWLKSKGMNYSHATVIGWFKAAARILEPMDEPLREELANCENLHSDESTLSLCDQRLPKKGEDPKDVENDEHYFKRWIFAHHSPEKKLTQFYFHERGRRTQEAIQKYLEKVTKRLWLHSDGAALYKCYDDVGMIMRIACAVHMRRPFYRLKDSSEAAAEMVNCFDRLFHIDKKIHEDYKDNPEMITQQRILQIAPILHEIKSKLDLLKEELEQDNEPDLLKAVKYALTEFPCLLRCLEDGTLEFSNNSCERQIRRIAKYRNNSFTVGSPEAAVRFARMMSVFANIRQHKLEPIAYLKDVFRRIKDTAKESMAYLLPHKWEPILYVDPFLD